MDQLICTGRNHRIGISDAGDIIPEIEAILTLTGKHIEYVGAGMSTVERTTTVRFQMSPSTARKVSDNLRDWADESEELANRVSLAKAQD